MTPERAKLIRQEAGLSAARLARLFRLAKDGGRAVRRWEAGEREISGPVSILYELVERGELAETAD